MKEIMKNEWKKVWRSKLFWCALGIGVLLSTIQAFEHIGFVRDVVQQADYKGYQHPCGYETVTLNILWMGVDGFSPVSSAFYLLLPILSAMPMSASVIQEKRNGYMYQTMIRCGEKIYFRAKWKICFLTGGLVISIPLIVNLMIKGMICPMGRVTPLSLSSPLQGNFCSQLYYIFPLGYMGMVILSGFLWGGICSLLALACSGKIKNPVLIMIYPFLILLVIDIALEFIQPYLPIKGYELSPLGLFLALDLKKNPLWETGIYMSGLYLVALMVFRRKIHEGISNVEN